MTQGRHRSFSSAGQLPVTFDIDGEYFEAVPNLPYAVVRTVLQQLGPALEASDFDAIIGPLDLFYETCIAAKDRQRFIDFVASGRASLRTMVELAMWLMEQYTGRPTQPPSSSPAGPTDAGRGSTGGASETA